MLPCELLPEVFVSLGNNLVRLLKMTGETRLVTVGAEVRATETRGEDMSWPGCT